MLRKIYAATKVPIELGRRTGPKIDISKLKCIQLRNMVIFFFPALLADQVCQQKKNLILCLVFLYRAVLMPNLLFNKIPITELQKVAETFLAKFQSLFGIQRMTYSVHLILHVVLLRRMYEFTSKSTFRTESFYSLIRRFITPGTQSITKQVMERIYCYLHIKRNMHRCQDRLKFSVKETDRVNNSLIAITPYKFGKLVEINGDEGIVRIIETTPYGQAIRTNLP